MASRGGGRGRGRGQLTFNVEAVGIGKGDALPPPTLQPSPLFPPLEFRPVPLPSGEEGEYVLALKQELRGAMRQLPYFIRPAVPKRDWRRLPRELKIRVRKLQKERECIWKKGGRREVSFISLRAEAAAGLTFHPSSYTQSTKCCC
ncbi:polymerase (RNA) III (DNA directed) polypeptide G (32kD) like, isoform CRA_a [Homo sapiens]|nr:polymerase (RNA) III (DNA directed) polypeptide G (32kD) like, isoform CRA_a [Homo sapiens]